MITSVTIFNLNHNPDSRQLKASVVLSLQNGQSTSRVQFLCQIAEDTAEGAEALHLALAREALRQAHKLPFYTNLTETEAFLPANITLSA